MSEAVTNLPPAAHGLTCVNCRFWSGSCQKRKIGKTASHQACEDLEMKQSEVRNNGKSQ